MLRDATRGLKYREDSKEKASSASSGDEDPSSRDPLERVKHRVYLCSLVVSAPALPLLWLTLRGEDSFIRFAFPPMAVFCLWCVVALWREKTPIRRTERVTFAAVSTFALLHLIHSLSTTSDIAGLREAADVTTFPTLVVLYVIAYLIFETGDGLKASLLLYAASLALVMAGAFASGLAHLSGSEVSWLAQTYAFMGAVIALLYATSYAKSQLSRERALTEAMSELALTDQLTGIANRRRLYASLQREIETSKRYDHSLSLILFDLDHFKLINDAHGHDQGDEVLREVVQSIEPFLRKADHLGRWGGEEFIILTPETDLEQASSLAERLRLAVSEIDLDSASEVTASFGIARHDPEDETPESFIKRADEALYNAKAAGRNRVESFS